MEMKIFENTFPPYEDFTVHITPSEYGTELARGPPEFISALSFIADAGVHIGARALHVLNLLWFG